MQATFYVDDHVLSVDRAASRVAIEPLGGQLGIRISARWPDLATVAALRAKGLLPDYLEPAELLEVPLVLRFSATGVFTRGPVPSGIFAIEEGKHRATHSYLYVDGIDYGLDFAGRLVLSEAGSVQVVGKLRRRHEAGPSFPLRATLDYDAAELRVEEYAFTFLEEIRQMPTERVRRIGLRDFTGEDLPDWLADYTGVRKFHLGFRGRYDQTGRLGELPDWLGEWRQLEELSVHDHTLGHVPDAVGRLKRLRQVFFNRCALSELPPALWALPQLETLSLSNNQLTQIPEDVNLPRLQYLNLDDNRLTTLPAGLFARSPELSRLGIERNAFTRLPVADLARVAEVRIEVEVRQALAPRPPATGGAYRPEDFAIDSAGSRSRTVDELLQQQGIGGPVADFLRATATPAVGFTQASETTDNRVLGCHRFGGLPDLPAGQAYPRFGSEQLAYEFIAQLDCADLAPLQRYLPRTGFLYCFLSTFHDLYGEARSDYPVALVVHHDVERTDLVAGGTAFAHLTTADYFEAYAEETPPPGRGTPCYRGFDCTATATVGLPPLYPLHANLSLLGPALASAGLLDASGELRDLPELDQDVTGPEQRYDHLTGSYGFSQHELPVVQAALALGGAPEEYTVLLEVRSRGDMQWGDAGELHLVIHKGALARRDFSRVFAGMYSS